MNTRYSAYDQLNAGRQRRSASSLQDLEATIGGIEARLEKMRGAGDPVQPSYSDDIAERMRRLSSDLGAARPSTPLRQEPVRPSLERDINRLRQEEAQQSQMASIVNELQSMRSEMRQLSAAAARPKDDWNAGLRKEIEAIKYSLGSLAREDTLRSVETRWAQAPQAPALQISDDPVIAALLDRVDIIQNAVSSLPQSLSITGLEEKVRVLASAIDQLSRRSNDINPEKFLQIEDRLDEISRAIVASSVSVQAVGNDKAAFERLEARLAALNNRMDEMLDHPPVQQVQDRIAQLAMQMDAIASRSGAPVEQMSRMGSQLEAIASKLSELESRNVDADMLARGLDDRLHDIAGRLEQSQVQSDRENRAVLSELENRLEEISARLAEPAAPYDNSGPILAAVDQRFEDLSRQLSMHQPSASIDPAFAESIEQRLAEITSRLNTSTASVPAADTEAFDRLESHVQALSRQLAQPQHGSDAFDSLAPRLASIEQSLAMNHETLLAAARHAAEDALRNASFNGSSPAESEAVAQLANDLKSLDILARKSDERNSKTFEAIHDTLLKIVDRLGTLEAVRSAPAAAPVAAPVAKAPAAAAIFDEPDFDIPVPSAAKMELGAAAPALDVQFDGDGLEDFEPMPVRSPAEAALAAANAARDMAGAVAKEAAPKEKGGFLSGLTKALRREDPKASGALAGSTLPAEIADQPNADWSSAATAAATAAAGTPDLNTIMKRVRDERRAKTGGEGEDTAKNDFLAAARRAAQAAAADAEILKNRNAKASKNGGNGLSDAFNRNRKPILIAALAIMVALTGLQLGKAFLGGEPVQPVVSEAAPVKAQADVPADDTAADATAADKTALSPAADTAMAPAAADVRQASDVAAPVPAADVTKPEPAIPATDVAAPSEPALPPVAGAQDQADVAIAAPAAAASSNADSVPAEAGPIALREAAANGDAKAMFEIGARFADGAGVNKDAKAALSWFQKAADAGFAPAQFRLGSQYEKGIGVERSAGKAKALYEQAAQQGNAGAMHNLAVLLAMGAIGPADNQNAAKWFTKAAELGVKDSQYNLGILAAKGLGVPQSLEESYKWFALAAKTGDKDASQKRDEVANVMRPEQLQRARAATELWKAKPLAPEANSIEIPDSWKSDNSQTASTPAPSSAELTKAIKNIQIILNQNGYDAGSPDGKMGGKTKKAIAAYQKANGMAATGEVDEALIKSLLKKVKS